MAALAAVLLVAALVAFLAALVVVVLAAVDSWYHVYARRARRSSRWAGRQGRTWKDISHAAEGDWDGPALQLRIALYYGYWLRRNVADYRK